MPNSNLDHSNSPRLFGRNWDGGRGCQSHHRLLRELFHRRHGQLDARYPSTPRTHADTHPFSTYTLNTRSNTPIYSYPHTRQQNINNDNSSGDICLPSIVLYGKSDCEELCYSSQSNGLLHFVCYCYCTIFVRLRYHNYEHIGIDFWMENLRLFGVSAVSLHCKRASLDVT